MGKWDRQTWEYEYELEDGEHIMVAEKSYSPWSDRYTLGVHVRNRFTGDQLCRGDHFYIEDIKDRAGHKNEIGSFRAYPRIKLGSGETIHLKRDESKKVREWIFDLCKRKEEMRDDLIDDILGDEETE